MNRQPSNVGVGSPAVRACAIDFFKSMAFALALLANPLLCPIAGAQTAATVAATAQAEIDKGSTPPWWAPELPEDIRIDVDRKSLRLAEQLALNEPQMERATQLIAEHFGRVWAWHQQADSRLDAAWAAWDEARNNSGGKQKDELRALTIMSERIDPLYAEFTPQIQSFLHSLQTEIGEAKTVELLDLITRSPGAKRTYEAYVAMVPEMKAEEKAILWERMVQAREDSLAAWTDKQIVKIFKKYKVRNEFSIDYFGYGYQQRYQAWVKASR